MKRSELNNLIDEAVAFCKEKHFLLPPFAYWGLQEWKTKGDEYAEIMDNQMGWDITDFGSGDFQKIGLLIFVLRNGNFTNPKYVKPYCEKILIQDEGQVLPLHFHWRKMEDIINRGGGDLVVELYNSISDNEWDTQTPVTITMDGRGVSVPAGEPLVVKPGESITLAPGQFHKSWAREGTGKVLLGEVSTVADESADNNFPEYSGRLPAIVEDVPPKYLIFADYALLKSPHAWPETWKTRV
jgi:D-lyxose ketol-isomerase